MNPFWTSVGVWAFFSYKARKEKKKNDAIYEQALRDAQEEFAPQQAEYEQWVQDLPALSGPRTFDIRINTHLAEEGVIDMYAEYLERQFDLNQDFVAVIHFDKDNPNHNWSIKVVVSQAIFGYLHHPFNQDICKELEKLGGTATCSAKMRKNDLTGQYSVYLDLDLPITVDKPEMD